MKYESLLSRHSRISDQVSSKELGIILAHLERQLQKGTTGSCVEFGCYVGTTSLFIRRLLDAYESTNEFHVYDSFSGLPEKTAKDSSPAGEQFRAGELVASKKEYLMAFKRAGLKPPMIHKAWFHDLGPSDVPSNVSFAFLDGDYYESIMTPLQLLWPQLVDRAIVIIDDYANEALPGAAAAVDEWVKTHSVTMQIEASLAILHYTSSGGLGESKR